MVQIANVTDKLCHLGNMCRYGTGWYNCTRDTSVSTMDRRRVQTTRKLHPTMNMLCTSILPNMLQICSNGLLWSTDSQVKFLAAVAAYNVVCWRDMGRLRQCLA